MKAEGGGEGGVEKGFPKSVGDRRSKTEGGGFEKKIRKNGRKQRAGEKIKSSLEGLGDEGVFNKEG